MRSKNHHRNVRSSLFTVKTVVTVNGWQLSVDGLLLRVDDTFRKYLSV